MSKFDVIPTTDNKPTKPAGPVVFDGTEVLRVLNEIKQEGAEMAHEVETLSNKLQENDEHVFTVLAKIKSTEAKIAEIQVSLGNPNGDTKAHGERAVLEEKSTKDFKHYEKIVEDFTQAINLWTPIEDFKNILNSLPLEEILKSEYKYKFFEKITSSGIVNENAEHLFKILASFCKKDPNLFDLTPLIKESIASDENETLELNGIKYQKDTVILNIFTIFDSIHKFGEEEKSIIMNNIVLLQLEKERFLSSIYKFASILNCIDKLKNKKIENEYKECIENNLINKNKDFAELLNCDISFIRDHAQLVAKKEIEKISGINDFNINAIVDSDPENYFKSLDTMAYLEKQEIGSVKKLFNNYGILEFYRYPEEMLLAQSREENTQKPYGLVVFPRSDHNGALDNQKSAFQGLFNEVKGRFGIKIVECGSKTELAKKLLFLEKKFDDKISFLFIGGHGNEKSISLGDSDPRFSDLDKGGLPGVIHIEDLQNPSFIHANKRFLDKNAPIVLFSCVTGAPNGIAEQSSGIYKRKITAPNVPVASMQIKTSFNNSGKPSFEVIYDNDTSITANFDKKPTNY